MTSRSKSKKQHEMMQTTTTTKWFDLPLDLMVNILSRVVAVDKLWNVRKVCRDWRKICKDPSMWRVIYMDSFCDDELLDYVADRSPKLSRLEIAYPKFSVGNLSKALKKLPKLEELSIRDAFELQLDQTLVLDLRLCPYVDLKGDIEKRLEQIECVLHTERVNVDPYSKRKTRAHHLDQPFASSSQLDARFLHVGHVPVSVWEETKAKGVMDADFKLLLYAVDAVKERLSKLKLVVRYKALQDVELELIVNFQTISVNVQVHKRVV
nr:hypothetical protein [Tanacetum cinerariifolium]